MGFYHQFQTSATFATLISFIQIHVHKFKNDHTKPQDLMRTNLFKRNWPLKLYIILCVYMFDLKNTRYDLQNKQLLKLPETSSSRYGTQAFCFKGSLILNMVPNKFKNLESIEDFKEHIKDWKPTTCSGKLCL